MAGIVKRATTIYTCATKIVHNKVEGRNPVPRKNPVEGVARGSCLVRVVNSSYPNSSYPTETLVLRLSPEKLTGVRQEGHFGQRDQSLPKLVWPAMQTDATACLGQSRPLALAQAPWISCSA